MSKDIRGRDDFNDVVGETKMRSLAFALAISTMALLPSGSAGALPLAPAASSGVEPEVLLVRDGCGRGMRWSNRMQACVQDFGPGPRYYDDSPDTYVRPVNPPRVVVVPPRMVVPPRVVTCPPGQRWSNGRGTCVWM